MNLPDKVVAQLLFAVALGSVTSWGLVWLSDNPAERGFWALCGTGLAGVLFWMLVIA